MATSLCFSSVTLSAVDSDNEAPGPASAPMATPSVEDGYYRVGIPPEQPTQPTVYVQNITGIVWAVPMSLESTIGDLAEVMNGRILDLNPVRSERKEFKKEDLIFSTPELKEAAMKPYGVMFGIWFHPARS